MSPLELRPAQHAILEALDAKFAPTPQALASALRELAEELTADQARVLNAAAHALTRPRKSGPNYARPWKAAIVRAVYQIELKAAEDDLGGEGNARSLAIKNTARLLAIPLRTVQRHVATARKRHGLP